MPFAQFSGDALFEQLKSTLETLTSPVAGEPLFSGEDAFGPVIVRQHDDYRTLCFDAVFEQSKMRMSAPAEPVFTYIRSMLLASCFAPNRTALVLGLGGGSLVRALAQLQPDCVTTAVEIRPLVIDVAQRFFLLENHAHCQLVCADASEYLRQASPHATDLILADLYWSLVMDQQQKSSEFIQLCKNHLSEQGWLALNMASRKDVDDKLLQVLYRSFDDVFSCSFPNSNTVLLAGSVQQCGGMANFYQRLEQVSDRWHGALDGVGRALVRVTASNLPAV